MVLIIKTLKNLLRPLKKALKKILPNRLVVGPAVVQAYLGGIYETRYTLTNFPSLYSPLHATPCTYIIEIYDESGNLCASKKIFIDVFGSLEVQPKELFGDKLPDLGLFSARILPQNPNSLAHLGKINSHFYALYSDKEHNSYALVHPQTYINEPRSEQQEWISGIFLDASRVSHISAIQINPTKKSVETNLFLILDESIVLDHCNRPGIIPPMGTRCVRWNIAELGFDNGNIVVAGRGLPTNNAKPILLTFFKDGTFSGMHG
jgi:hypothetical protein